MVKHLKRRKGNSKSKNFKKAKLKPSVHKTRYRDYKHTEQRRLLVKQREENERKSVKADKIEENEEREVDTLTNLLSTFSNHSSRTIAAVDSDDTSEEEDDVNQVENENENSIEATELLMDDDDDNEELDDGETNIEQDPYSLHILGNLRPSLLANLQASQMQKVEHRLDWPLLGSLKVSIPSEKCGVIETTGLLETEKFVSIGDPPHRITKIDWNNLHVKAKLSKNVGNALKAHIPESADNEDMTALQKELFSIMNNYQDLVYPMRTIDNGEEVRFAYCLHAVNHILKTRDQVIRNNDVLSSKETPEADDEFRDQGLVRPKVLILVPFRDACYRVVNMIATMLFNNRKANVLNKARFDEEFTGSELFMPKKNRKPEDFEKLFSGNVDDSFRIGLSFTKKSLKLYSDFYSSDVIIASPLGVRMLIGAEGEKERDYDFLASMELLILDQTEVFYMQNWDHVLHIMNHLHMQPRESHGTDFTRVRLWALHGWARYYRQTLLFSSVLTPEMNAVFSRYCANYAGLVKVAYSSPSTISQVLVPLPHVYRRFESSSPVEATEERFRYFLENVLPQFVDLSAVLIYVPSYFDFVRIRNHLKSKDFSFVQISEYSKDAKVARARDMFFHEQVKMLLYSERFHFFRRVNVKGIRHLLFYQPPVFPHFYSEMCNLMQDFNQNAATQDGTQSVTVLYSKYDCHALSGIIRPSRANHIISSDKSVFMFTTGDMQN